MDGLAKRCTVFPVRARTNTSSFTPLKSATPDGRLISVGLDKLFQFLLETWIML